MIEERIQSLFRIMEIRNRFVKHRSVKIGKTSLELTERLARSFDHLEILRGIKGYGIDIVDDTPERVITDVIIRAVFGMIIVKCSLIGIFFADISGHTVNVFHDLNRIFENMSIDSLKKVRCQIAVLSHIGHLIGRIDIAHRNGLVGVQFSLQIKFLSDFV